MSLNICAVFLILLINVHVNLARFATGPDIENDALLCVSMVSEKRETN